MRIERREWGFIGTTSALLVAVLWGTGWTSPWVTLDTSSYLSVSPYPEFFFDTRAPFYGWLVAMLGGEPQGFGPTVWLHVLVHVAAAAALYAGARHLGLGRAAAAALFLAALSSQNFLIFGRGIVPEAPAMSLALIAMAATLACVRSPHWLWFALPAGLAAAAAYVLRPTYLPLIVTLPLLQTTAARLTGEPLRLGRALVLMSMAAAPFVAYSTERMRHTGDFNLVSYGGFVMSGMSGFLLSEEVVQRFPPQERELAAQILAERKRLEAEGRIARTPLNSTGDRSFVSAAAGYFDIYARSYDELVHNGIQRLKRADEDWVAFDRRLKSFAVTTVRLVPDRYVAWVAGATSRLLGRMLVTNGPFLIASIGFLLMLARTVLRPAGFRSLHGTSDTLAVVVVVAIYLLTSAPLTVLITFPSSRYIDAAAILLPALPIYAAIRLAQALRSARKPSQPEQA
jgi:hypothetical protein